MVQIKLLLDSGTAAIVLRLYIINHYQYNEGTKCSLYMYHVVYINSRSVFMR